MVFATPETLITTDPDVVLIFGIGMHRHLASPSATFEASSPVSPPSIWTILRTLPDA
jgi:hypothetical protein